MHYFSRKLAVVGEFKVLSIFIPRNMSLKLRSRLCSISWGVDKQEVIEELRNV